MTAERRRRRKAAGTSLKSQIRRTVSGGEEQHALGEYEGTDRHIISTTSTLLDLAISGGRFPEGGIPSGILVEIFGPSSAGKTVLLCSIAGAVLRQGGDVLFHDPEARLSTSFARMFGMDLGDDRVEYDQPDTVTQVFQQIRAWDKIKDRNEDVPLAVLADSLAALSTDMEMKDGDKYGMRRAKEFSEQLRITCRLFKQKHVTMVASNQIRQNADAGPYGQKYVSPGGEAIGFYSSLRLRCRAPKKLHKEKTIRGKKVKRPIGVQTQVEVYKNSVWKPYRTASVTVIFDYGIDDIRENLQFLKTYTKSTVYCIGDTKLDQSMDKSIEIVEREGLEQELKEEVIRLWRRIEGLFSSGRKPRFHP